MKRIINKIKRLFKLIKKINSSNINKGKYLKYYEKLSLKDNYILLDSQHGKNIKGNIFYILKELNNNPKYESYKLFLLVNNKCYKEQKNFLKINNINKVKLIKNGTKKYYKLLASSKYLINDTSFLPFFMKKEGQVYLNVWHGTPLKKLGKGNNKDYYALGNVQRNFLNSDYLLYPNEYMMNHMIEDYMLENICDAKCVLLGYPRNTIFFDKNNRLDVRNKLNINNKQVIAYMPTYRDNKKVDEELKIIVDILNKIDEKLNDKQIMYVNLHPLLNDKINYNFKHIKKFPSEYETYEFLNATDCLVTDYSSVFYDYANTRNKIILFTYDEKEYLENRGCYISLEELPFAKVKTVNNLIKEINSSNKINYNKFINCYCKYDSINATEKICSLLIENKDEDINIKNINKNYKKNILIDTGSLAKNGITTSLGNLLNNLDLNKYNYYLTYTTKVVKRNPEFLRQIPQEIKYLPIDDYTNGTFFQKGCIVLWYEGLIRKYGLKILKKVYKYNIKRCYGNIKFDKVINFCGYSSRKIMLYSLFDCDRIIYVHSNMEMEIKHRKNQRKFVLEYAYNNYDKVAVVSDSLITSTKKFIKNPNKIHVVNNVIDYKTIIKKSNEEIIFDEDTECNIKLEELKKILNNKENIKFITVGRFSVEKGHERLMRAFEKIYQKNKNAYLVIIGGHGDLYNKTLNLKDTLSCGKNIIIIKSLKNPFPIVKKCNCFVLSSLYEGFGLCLVEADILGLITFSVNIDGPKKFILNNNGNLVENSNEGIYSGMAKYISGDLQKMNVDYEKYNQQAIKEFNNMIKE